MDFALGLLQTIGVHTLLGLSAYVVLLTGQLSMAQAAFFAIGAYSSGMLTVLAGWHLVPAMLSGAFLSSATAFLVGLPAIRVRGLVLVIATLTFGEAVRLFLFNFDYQVVRGGLKLGPVGAEGFRQIRFFQEHGWSTGEVAAFIWTVLLLVMVALWWLDRSRLGAALRSVGEDDVAARAVGINTTAMKVLAVTLGGFIAGLAGALYAHYATHIEHGAFGVLQAVFAVAYPLIGGLSSVVGTLLAVVFVQGFLIEALRFLADWRSLLFGALIVLAMNLRPGGLIDFTALRRALR